MRAGVTKKNRKEKKRKENTRKERTQYSYLDLLCECDPVVATGRTAAGNRPRQANYHKSLHPVDCERTRHYQSLAVPLLRQHAGSLTSLHTLRKPPATSTPQPPSLISVPISALPAAASHDGDHYTSSCSLTFHAPCFVIPLMCPPCSRLLAPPTLTLAPTRLWHMLNVEQY